ncbi:MAG: histidine kinase [Candidatus Choladocola sp.]|nr:histidine kinase [Candidatus Choladocola sp.]
MKSLHFKLFWRYFILILTVLFISVLLLYRVWGDSLRDNASSELLADCDNISTMLDTQIQQMNELSKRIINTHQLQELFLQDLYSDETEAYYNRRSFSDTLFDIIKLSFNHMELNIFDTAGRYIHVGMTSSFQRKDENLVTQLSWGQSVLDAYGKKVILPPGSDKLNNSETPMISLCRAFAPENPTRETAILELQIEYTYLAGEIEDSIHNQKDQKKVFVYNEKGEQIYPYEAEISTTNEKLIAAILSDIKTSSENLQFTRDKSEEPVLFAYTASENTGWTIFVAESEKDLFSSFYQFRSTLILVFLLALLLTVIVTNRIAGSLARPIQEMAHATQELTLNNLDTFQLPEAKNKFRELSTLYHSFDQMRTNLKNSLQETVAERTIAVDAQMLALQSQMNPHFLYNTLTTISILAEEEDTEKIVQICEDLTALLRYISSGSDREVPLSMEIEQTVSYENIIKIKYEDRIHFHMKIDSSLLPVRIPKLVVQPLVENCIKYALNVEPPWEISICGYRQDHHWIIQVSDNGPGFSEEFLNTFYAKAEKLLSDKSLTTLNINGMGLLNLYMRLYLLYKEKMIFRIENMAEGGACVTAGGPLPQDFGGDR